MYQPFPVFLIFFCSCSARNKSINRRVFYVPQHEERHANEGMRHFPPLRKPKPTEKEIVPFANDIRHVAVWKNLIGLI